MEFKISSGDTKEKGSVNGVDKPTRLLRFVTFVHLPISVRSLNLFVASLVFMKGTSCCVIRSNCKYS